MKIENIKKILIFKLCCFGDTVFMTPAIHSLKKAFPGAKIFYAYSDWVFPMMKFIPDIDESIKFENVYSRNIFLKISGAIKFIFKARREKFDLVLYGHRTNHLAFILALCSIRLRLGFKGTSYLTHKAEFHDNIQEYKRYLEILEECGIKTADSVPFLLKPDKIETRKKYNLNTEKLIVGIFPIAGQNPGTLMSIKRWDLKKYYELAEKINKNNPETVLIFFEGKSNNEKLEFPTNIKAVKAEIDNELISCCDLFISADTGSLHIAAGFDVPTISIFGPTDPRILAPPNSLSSRAKHKYIWKKPACAPCYTPVTAIDKKNQKYWKKNEFLCYLGTNECMRSVSIDEVYELFLEMI